MHRHLVGSGQPTRGRVSGASLGLGSARPGVSAIRIESFFESSPRPCKAGAHLVHCTGSTTLTGIAASRDPEPDDRVPMNVRVSKYARDGWNEFAAREGVSLTSLLDVMGRVLADRRWQPDSSGLTIIAEARGLDAERRRRT